MAWGADALVPNLLRAQVQRNAKSTTMSFSNGLEFKVGEGGGGGWTRGALPKGTTRKCATSLTHE